MAAAVHAMSADPPKPPSLQQFFRTHVPLALAMGVEVVEAAPACVRLRFPMAPNLNHHGTAFGGSISAAGILAGWSLMHVGLVAAEVDAAATVVADSRTRYRRPIDAAAFEARSVAPAPAEWRQFLDMLDRWGRARLSIRTEVREAGDADDREPAAVHDGVYVAIRESTAG